MLSILLHLGHIRGKDMSTYLSGMLFVWQVRNEAAEDYLQLLKEWQKLCQKYPEGSVVEPDSDEEDDDDEGPGPGEYEVEKLLGIRWIGEVSDKDKEVMEQVDDMVDDEELPNRKTPKQASAAKEDEPPLTKGLEFKVSFISVWMNLTCLSLTTSMNRLNEGWLFT